VKKIRQTISLRRQVKTIWLIDSKGSYSKKIIKLTSKELEKWSNG